MSDNEKNNNYSPSSEAEDKLKANEITTSSNAELQVEENKIKIISPGRMVLKRFFRSRLSVIGLVTLIVLFTFAIIGPLFSPWGESEADMRIVPSEPFDSRITDYIEVIKSPESISEMAVQCLGEDGIKSGDTDSVITDKIKKYNKALYNKYKNETGSFVHNGETIYFEIELNQNQYTIYILDEVIAEDESVTYVIRKNDIIKRTYGTKIVNLNDSPSSDHWLGTDASGYDVLTRLMYGGRISLTLGFVVVFIAAFIGVTMGGIAGYFGKWADLIIMRIIDLIYCLPTLPIMLIFSAILDGLNVDEGIRIYFLMGMLSLLGWAGTASLVRAQILTLREQEFMVAAEALGISVPRRIIKHLVPNIMPLLIVSMTMSLGGTILTESTLSYLGLGIRAPKAAWGTMIGAAQEPVILEFYPNQWVPAGILIIFAVLAFNFIGDGLRDAFDPKMKR